MFHGFAELFLRQSIQQMLGREPGTACLKNAVIDFLEVRV